MYRALLEKDFYLANHKTPAGSILLVEDVTAAAILTLRVGEIEPVGYTTDTSPPEPGDDVLLIRPGGFGDLLFLTPIIAELVRIGCRVTVCAHSHFHSILQGQPCEMVPYPMLESDISKYEHVYWLENAVENATDETNIVDLFAQRIGIGLKEKACNYIVTDEEKAWSTERFPRNGRPRVAVQAEASAACRSYPQRALMGACSMLAMKGYEIFLFGAPGSLRIDAAAPYVNLTAYDLSMRQSAAVLAGCDAAIAPDSAICHLGGALGIPTLGLFGPFSWQSRTKYHPSVFGMNGVAPCAPCHHHARTEVWPAGMPCNTAKFCVALGSIQPERIVAKIEQMVMR